MSFEKLIKAPPKPYTKKKPLKGPFSKSNECCLTANQWQQLYDWIFEHYRADRLGEMMPLSTYGLTRLIRGEPIKNMLNPRYSLELEELKFCRKLDEAAVMQSVKRLVWAEGWSIDQNGFVRRGEL